MIDKMYQKQIAIIKKPMNENCEIFTKLSKNCYYDSISGFFRCRNCHNIVNIELNRNYAFCPIHGRII